MELYIDDEAVLNNVSDLCTEKSELVHEAGRDRNSESAKTSAPTSQQEAMALLRRIAVRSGRHTPILDNAWP